MASELFIFLFKFSKILCFSNYMFVRHSVSWYPRFPRGASLLSQKEEKANKMLKKSPDFFPQESYRHTKVLSFLKPLRIENFRSTIFKVTGTTHLLAYQTTMQLFQFSGVYLFFWSHYKGTVHSKKDFLLEPSSSKNGTM